MTPAPCFRRCIQAPARELIKLALRGRFELLISPDVLDETSRNLARKAPDKADALEDFLQLLAPKVIQAPSKQEVWGAEKYVVQKDAPIIAAVKEGRADFLVTLDKKHLLNNPKLSRYVKAMIGTPQEALAYVRGEHEGED